MSIPGVLSWFSILCALLASQLSAAEFGSGYEGPLADPAHWPAPTRFISPEGSDQASGRTPGEAWRTFAHAIAQLRPGDCLGLLDGQYDQENTGLIVVDSGNRGTAVHGQPDAPITIRAIHERKAVLVSEGLTPGLWMTRARYWNVLGLTVLGRDQATGENAPYHITMTGLEPVYALMAVNRSNHIALKRLLLARSNRQGRNANNHLSTVEDSRDVLVEECEAYWHHRHAFLCWQSERVTYRRNYINPRFHRGPGERGDEAIAFYRSSWSVAENNISEGYNLGFQAHGGLTYETREGGSYNKFFGNISLDSFNATRVDPRLTPYPQHHPAVGNHFRNFLVVRPRHFGIWLSSTTGTMVENVTVIGGARSGLVADQREDAPCEVVPGGCSLVVRNSFFADNAEWGVQTSYPEWQVEHSLFSGNGAGAVSGPGQEGRMRASNEIPIPERAGDPGECLVLVPDHSPRKGAGVDGSDIGANIIYRYEGAYLTRQPLWSPETGAFPQGGLVAGINDIPGESLFDVHTRLGVTPERLPYGKRATKRPAPGR